MSALMKSIWGRGISVSTQIIVLTLQPDNRSYPNAHLESWKGGKQTFPMHLITLEMMLKWRRYRTNSAAPQSSVIQINPNKSVEYLNVSHFASYFEDMRTLVMSVRWQSILF